MKTKVIPIALILILGLIIGCQKEEMIDQADFSDIEQIYEEPNLKIGEEYVDPLFDAPWIIFPGRNQYRFVRYETIENIENYGPEGNPMAKLFIGIGHNEPKVRRRSLPIMLQVKVNGMRVLSTVIKSGFPTYTKMIPLVPNMMIEVIVRYSTGIPVEISLWGLPIQFNCGDNLIDNRDPSISNSYPTVLIDGPFGLQCWMAKNLAYLPQVHPPGTISDTDPRYYVYGYSGGDPVAAQSSPNYGTYGVLYNWSAAMVSCPDGWRLPSDFDWAMLEGNLGMSAPEFWAVGARPSGNVGHQLKFTSGWLNNGNGSNSSGFAGLPGGTMNTFLFDHIPWYGYFWTSTPAGPWQAWYRILAWDIGGVYRYGYVNNMGFSVRCIQNLDD